MVLVKHRGIASIKALETFCKIAMLPSGETEMPVFVPVNTPSKGKSWGFSCLPSTWFYVEASCSSIHTL